MANEKKTERDPAIAWLFENETSNGVYYTSAKLTEDRISEIVDILRAGGKFKFATVKAEKAAALISFVPPEKVAAQAEAYRNRVGRKETNRAF